MESKDVRNYRRKRVYIPVVCSLGSGTYHTRAWTLGAGGLFLGMPPQISPGTELTVRFSPAASLPAIEAKAQVRYQLPDQGIGIEFTDIKPEHRRMIMLLVGHRMVERRLFPRAPLQVPVEDEGGRVIGVSRDISVGGMLIETATPPSLDSRLELRFRLNDGGPVISAKAQLRYALGHFGMGIEFIGLSSLDRTRINVYVTKSEGARPLL